MKEKIEKIKIELKKRQKAYLIESSDDVVIYLHNLLINNDKVVVEVMKKET